MNDFRKFIQGLLMGATATLLLSVAVIYFLNMQGMVVISVASIPDLQLFLKWAFDNLRLSMIPFALFFLLYLKDLIQLKKLLKDAGTSMVQENKETRASMVHENLPQMCLVKVSQKEHLVDIWINIFFGIGVIWTAIGMRGALMNGLGNISYRKI